MLRLMSTVTLENRVCKKCDEGSTPETELHPCRFTDSLSSLLLSFDDEGSPTACTGLNDASDAVRGVHDPYECITGYSGCTRPVPADLESEFSAWSCRHCFPVLGAEGLPVPVSRTIQLQTSEVGRSARNGSRTTHVPSENRGTVRAPVRRRTPLVGFNQPLMLPGFGETAFGRYEHSMDGWSTSSYAEHYRRHCTADNVGSVAVGERTLADLDPGDDPYRRQLRLAW